MRETGRTWPVASVHPSPSEVDGVVCMQCRSQKGPALRPAGGIHHSSRGASSCMHADAETRAVVVVYPRGMPHQLALQQEAGRQARHALLCKQKQQWDSTSCSRRTKATSGLHAHRQVRCRCSGQEARRRMQGGNEQPRWWQWPMRGVVAWSLLSTYKTRKQLAAREHMHASRRRGRALRGRRGASTAAGGARQRLGWAWAAIDRWRGGSSRPPRAEEPLSLVIGRRAGAD
jgi:hypothetical protein